MKKTVAILANVSGLWLKSNHYSCLLFCVRCKVPTLASLDISENELKAVEAKVLAQGIRNWFVFRVFCD
jgi:hypothetical protein